MEDNDIYLDLGFITFTTNNATIFWGSLVILSIILLIIKFN